MSRHRRQALFVRQIVSCLTGGQVKVATFIMRVNVLHSKQTQARPLCQNVCWLHCGIWVLQARRLHRFPGCDGQRGISGTRQPKHLRSKEAKQRQLRRYLQKKKARLKAKCVKLRQKLGRQDTQIDEDD